MQWDIALHEFYRFHAVSHPNTVAFSAAISACETCGQWLQAMHLFEAGPMKLGKVKMWYTTHGDHPKTDCLLQVTVVLFSDKPEFFNKKPQGHKDVLLRHKVPKDPVQVPPGSNRFMPHPVALHPGF